jgi:hypothetical protein
MGVLLGIFAGALVVVVIMVLLLMRRVGHSQSLVSMTRTDKVRAEARAEAAEDAADRITGVAENALDVASEITKVSSQMDLLLGHVGIDEEPTSNRGKHVRDLHVVSDEQNERFIA